MRMTTLAILAVMLAAASAETFSNPFLAYYRTKYGPDEWIPKDREQRVPTGKYLRACYFTNWAQYRQGKGKFLPEAYEPGLCTHILFAFGWMNEDYTMRAFDPADVDTSWARGMFNRVNDLKKKDPNLKTLLSVGGWTFGTRLFKAMAVSSDSRSIFIESAMKFVRQNGFDGLDIDWEYPAGDDDKQHFSDLIRECRLAFEKEAKRLNRPRLLLSAAVSAGEATIKNAYDIPAIAENFDFVLLMSYDFHGAWEAGTGMNSPLYARTGEVFWQQVWNVDWAANHWVDSGMPKEKLIIGIPTYGRGWTLKHPKNETGLAATTAGAAKATTFVREAGVAAYYEFCEMLAAGARRTWDAEHQVPYLVHGDQWFSYDDEQSIRNKMGWLKSGGFGGAFVWTLDFDDFGGSCEGGKRFPLISLIRDELTSSAPTATEATPGPTPEGTTQMATTMPVTPPLFTPPVSTEGPPSPGPSGLCRNLGNGFQPLLRRPGHPDAVNDCGKFLLCLDQQSYRMACPAALEYDHDVGYCREMPDSECRGGGGSMTTTPTTAVVTDRTTADMTDGATTPDMMTSTFAPISSAKPTLKPTGAFACRTPGFFASPSCCRAFFRCVDFGPSEGLRAFPFACPAPLHFDAEMRVCVHPSASDCVEAEGADCE